MNILTTYNHMFIEGFPSVRSLALHLSRKILNICSYRRSRSSEILYLGTYFKFSSRTWPAGHIG